MSSIQTETAFSSPNRSATDDPEGLGCRCAVHALDADIPLTRYVDNWGREGDVALIAHETGNRVGAAWFRVFRDSEPGYGFIDEQTPELSISVVPSRRKHGVGQELLDALLE